jgi:hypothetical protein
VTRKQAVPRLLGDDPDRQAIARIGAGIAVLDEELLALAIVQHPLMHGIELGGLDRPVDLAPPDLVFARGLADDELVVR